MCDIVFIDDPDDMYMHPITEKLRQINIKNEVLLFLLSLINSWSKGESPKEVKITLDKMGHFRWYVSALGCLQILHAHGVF